MAEVTAHQTDTNRASERPYRSTAVIVGVLFIIATAFLFVGETFYGPILESDEVLQVAYPDRGTAVGGVLLEFVCVLAILLIPVFLFPVLRRQNEALALGYAGFRFLEAVLFVAIEVNLLSLIGVSEDYLASGSDSASYEAIANSIRSQNDWIFFMYVITFAIGALLLYTLLYELRLVPRWLSVWGLIAGGMILVGTVLIMLEALDGVPGLESELIWAAPIAVQEIVMALWLIIKGFSTTALRATASDASPTPDRALRPR